MNENKYSAGVCNIGPQEINRRKRVGWIGLVGTLILIVVLILLRVNPWWRLITFFPAMLSSSGFIQAKLHFCAGFARRGVYNFDTLGKVQEVKDEASELNDRRRGNQITIYSMLIGAVFGLLSVFIKL